MTLKTYRRYHRGSGEIMSNRGPKPCPSCGRDWITRVQGSTVGTLGDIVCEECGLRAKSLEQWDALPRREDETTVHLPCPDCGRRITIVMHDRQLGGDHE